jgi:hypothetical protein
MGESKFRYRAGPDSLMKGSPSLITPYFGRNCLEDEEISRRELSGLSFQSSSETPAKEIRQEGRLN